MLLSPHQLELPSAIWQTTAATRVDNFKATDVASVSKVIHTDNQLQARQFGKTAYTGWIRTVATPVRSVLGD
jgi:hypothetical protein